MTRQVRPTLVALLAIAAVAALAVGIRLVRLTSDPIWYDEAATLGIASMPWSIVFGPMAEVESSPPGYYAIAKLVTLAFGVEIMPLRLLSVLAGAAVLVPACLLARAGYGPRAAWLAALLLALAASHVRLSQDARGYTILFLLTVCAMCAAWRLATAVRAGAGGLPSAFALGVLMAAMLWIHPTASVIAVSLNAFALAAVPPTRDALRRLIPRLVAADVTTLAVATAPIFAILSHLLPSQDAFVDRWIIPPTIFEVIWLYGRTLMGPHLGLLAPLTVALQVAFIAAAAIAWRRTRNPMTSALAAMLLTGAFLLPLVSLIRPVLLDRTMLFLLAPLTLLVAGGAAAMPLRACVAGGLLLVALHATSTMRWHAMELRKERWDLAMAELARRIQPGEPIVVTEGALMEPAVRHHLRAAGMAPPRILIVEPDTDLDRLASKVLAPDRTVAPDAICRALGGSHALWLAIREIPLWVKNDPAFSMATPVRDALTKAGGHMTDAVRLPAASIERWAIEPC